MHHHRSHDSLVIVRQSPSQDVPVWEQVLLHCISRAVSTLGEWPRDHRWQLLRRAVCTLHRPNAHLFFHRSCAVFKRPSTMLPSYFAKATTIPERFCWPTKERLLVLSSLAMRTLVHRLSMMSMVAIITMLCISSSVSKYRPNLSEEKESVGKEEFFFFLSDQIEQRSWRLLECNIETKNSKSDLFFFLMFQWTCQSRTMLHRISAQFCIEKIVTTFHVWSGGLHVLLNIMQLLCDSSCKWCMSL